MEGSLKAGKGQSWCVNPLCFVWFLVFFRKVFHCVDQASSELKMILLPQLTPSPTHPCAGITGSHYHGLLGCEFKPSRMCFSLVDPSEPCQPDCCVSVSSQGPPPLASGRQKSPAMSPCRVTPSFPLLSGRDLRLLNPVIERSCPACSGQEAPVSPA